MTPTLAELNAAAADRAAGLLDGLYEQPWIAQAAIAQRPFRSLAHLKQVLAQVVAQAPAERRLALLRACAAPLAPDEALQQLQDAYLRRFAFPLIVASAGPRGTGLAHGELVAAAQRRLHNPAAFELAEAVRQLHRVAELRLAQRFGAPPLLGNAIWDWAQELAQFSDPEFKAQGQLTVTYLTEAHRACAARLAQLMHECGFDEVGMDAVGNVVGLYRAHPSSGAPRRLLAGSHYDTVRNGGRYDGRLGILTPMACVRELARGGRRLPFDIEVIGFAEEEGQRYHAMFLGSGALTGAFDPAWLEQRDADGVAMRDAMRQAGLPGTMDAIAALRRDPARYLAFLEVHIEQGPVLAESDLPLAVVTSINGGVRYLCEISGMASHAGTTPMDRRRDAACAAAELALFVEQRAARDGDSVGTVGTWNVPGGSINVVPGRCRFSLDLRAPNDAQRDALVGDVLAQLQAVCDRRGVSFEAQRTMSAAAAPCAPAWRERWERAVDSLGLPVHRMPSGAGHDAMKLHDVMPQAMLFVRGQNGGISHNPLESTTSDDMELAAQAMRHLLDELAREPGA